MKKLITLLLFVACCLVHTSSAQMPSKEERHKEMLKRFDSDGDGRISREEHAVLKKTMDKEMAERRKGRPPKNTGGETNAKKTPPSRIDNSFLKAEVMTIPDNISKKTETLRNEYVFFSQVKKKSGTKSPLIVYLHGSGGQGGPTSRHTKNAVGSLISKYKQPFTLLIPVFQKADDFPNGWNPDHLTTLLKYVITEHDIDPKRIYVTGHSMGGAGTLMWGNSYPDLFAAIAPTSAGGAESPGGELPVKASNFKNLPVWAFHGDQDGACDYRKIEKLIADIKKSGGKPKFTLIEGGEHMIKVHTDDKVLKWFLEHTR